MPAGIAVPLHEVKSSTWGKKFTELTPQDIFYIIMEFYRTH